MEKNTLGDITFTLHNKREQLWFSNLKWQVEILYKYYDNPAELLCYSSEERERILSHRLKSINGQLESAYWLDIIKESVMLFVEDDFREHFMFRR